MVCDGDRDADKDERDRFTALERAVQYADGKSAREVPWRFSAVAEVLTSENYVDAQDHSKTIDSYRVQRLMDILPKETGKATAENIPSQKDKSMFSMERYQFMLDAPFEIAPTCCSVMKKTPMKHYAKESGRVPITAQMASESRLRTQIWLRQGCNAFEAKNQMSNPMAFWTEQDVLLYIHTHFDEIMEWRKEEYRKVLEGKGIDDPDKIEELIVEEITYPIASVYGGIIKEKEIEGQLDLEDMGIFELERPTLKTTGCERTGCFACGFGMHHETCKEKSRIQKTIDFSNPKLADWQLRGGHFNEKGLWEPYKGLGMWFVIEWTNKYGNFKTWYPNREYYIEKYSTPETDKWLKEKLTERD